MGIRGSGVWRLGNTHDANTMTEPDVPPRPTPIPNIVSLLRRVIVTQYDPPIAAVCPWFQLLLQRSYDFIFAITAFRGNCYREPWWEPATADELLQTFVGSSILLCFEHTFGRRLRTSRDFGELRLCRQIGSPSRFDIRVAFDDWHCAASNSQGWLVLGTRLIVMERRLIPIQYQGIVPEVQEDVQPHSEQNDPEDFHALFLHVSGHCVLSVRQSHG